MIALTLMVRNIPSRTTIADFTEEIDEAGCTRQYNFFHLRMRMLCLCLVLMNLLHRVASPSSSFVTIATNTRLGREVGQIVTGTVSVKTTFMNSSHSLDTPSTWSSMRRPGSQRRLLERRETQEQIQVPWK